MKRYIFLLLAFFLNFNAYAGGFGISSSMIIANYNSNDAKIIKNSSARSLNEMGNIQESAQKEEQRSKLIPLDAQSPGVPNLGTKKGKTAGLSSFSCKTFEGYIFDQGQAGYNDCIRTIKNNNRQKDVVIP
jgi:hypothetical protein